MKELLSRLHAPIYRKRLETLTDLLLPWLEEGNGILDVGCGSGQLGARLVESARERRIHLNTLGLERFPRGGEPISVISYHGERFPFADRTFDMVIVADVLHHEKNPDELLRECVRVSRRYVAIKDHQLCGFLARMRVSLIDWAANAPYGVKCLYSYNSPSQWEHLLQKRQLTPVAIYSSLDLYPAGFNLLFGRKLQYLAICRVPDNTD